MSHHTILTQSPSGRSLRQTVGSVLGVAALLVSCADSPADRTLAIAPAQRRAAPGDSLARLVPGPGGAGVALLSPMSNQSSLRTQGRIARTSSLRPAASTPPGSTIGTSSFVVWQNASTGERVFWEMSGPVYTGTQSSFTLGPEWEIAAIADFSNDGNADVVWQNTVTGARVIWLMNGVTYSGTQVGFSVSPLWDIAAAADMTGDNKPDLVWQNKSTGERVIWEMNGTMYVGQVSFSVPTAWDIAAAADFTGDGKADLVWQNMSTGVRVIWQMNNTVYSGTQYEFSVGTAWQIAAAEDYTTDARPDLVWTNTVTGERLIWAMCGPVYCNEQYALATVGNSWKIAGTLALNTPVLFRDPFTTTGTKPNTNLWATEIGAASFLGRTQLQNWMSGSGVFNVGPNGAALTLSTYNPSGFSLFGTHGKSIQTFQPTATGAVILTSRVRLATLQPGLVFGVYFYLCGPNNCQTHDEIDIEILTNTLQTFPYQVQLNRYANEGFGAGHGGLVNLPAGFDPQAAHNWTIRWSLGRIDYYLDGKSLGTETTVIPQGPMQATMIVWGPAADWAAAYSGALQPSGSPGTTYTGYVRSMEVRSEP